MWRNESSLFKSEKNNPKESVEAVEDLTSRRIVDDLHFSIFSHKLYITKTGIKFSCSVVYQASSFIGLFVFKNTGQSDTADPVVPSYNSLSANLYDCLSQDRKSWSCEMQENYAKVNLASHDCFFVSLYF